MVQSAHSTCANMLDLIRNSQLDFYLQETPYSAFITIRKKYVKSFQQSQCKYTSITSSVLENLENENKKLVVENQEGKAELERSRYEVIILQKRLAKAEKDSIKDLEDRKNRNDKLFEEINVMKAIKKKDNDSISMLTSDLSKIKAEIKSIQKALHNEEKKSENLKMKLENISASKNELLEEKKKSTSENKNLKKKIKNLEEKQNSTMHLNNNSLSQSSSILFSNALSQTTLMKTWDISSSLKCLICAKVCEDSYMLKKHSEDYHELSIDIDKLTDPGEEDFTSRFINSLIVDPDYLKEIAKCFPKHWDHLNERSKVRMIAKMNFADKSNIIDKKMKEMEFEKLYYEGKSFETSML